MSSFKFRKEDCNKSLAKASNRRRYKEKSWHLPQSKQTSIVPEFDDQKVSIFKSYIRNYYYS